MGWFYRVGLFGAVNLSAGKGGHGSRSFFLDNQLTSG